MKKKIFVTVALTCVMTLSLTSCQINWFDRHYDVPWWMIAIPTTALLIGVWIIVGKHIASKKYICPKCNKTFYPKWSQAALSIHINDSRVFKCPHCGRKGFCCVSKETEE
ncbi:MAG: hypothetical protein IKJ07_08625 [Clostridia bacterium]|nr:hypothetical protein [Clostridia bacterium]